MQTQMEFVTDDEFFSNFLDTQMLEAEMSDDEFFAKLPLGYQFQPTDEMVLYYLALKINNEPLPRNRIHVVNLYQFHPQNLAEMYKPSRENEWYFFTPRDKKYKNGSRPNRVAGDGFWKATGSDKPIGHNGEAEIGSKRSLVFYTGKAPAGVKTEWMMSEFQLKNSPAPIQTTEHSMRLDDWVLCKMYKKKTKKSEKMEELHQGQRKRKQTEQSPKSELKVKEEFEPLEVKEEFEPLEVKEEFEPMDPYSCDLSSLDAFESAPPCYPEVKLFPSIAKSFPNAF